MDGEICLTNLSGYWWQAMANLDDFNPNKKPDKVEWATYLPARSRTASFKQHRQRGHALNAINNERQAILYRWNFEKNQWDEVLRVDGWPMEGDPCEHCMAPLPASRFFNNYGSANQQPVRAAAKRVWVRDGRGKISDPPTLLTVCHDCAEVLR